MLTEEKVKVVLAALKNYQQSLKYNGVSNNDPNFIKANFCINVLQSIEGNCKEWIDNCPFNNKTISEHITEIYIKQGIDDVLYLSCARFLREYILYLDRSGEEHNSLSYFWNDFLKVSNSVVNKHNLYMLDYFIKDFDISVINHYLGNKSYQAFINYEQTVKYAESKAQSLEESLSNKQKELEEKISSFETLLKEKKEKVDQLAKALEKQETGYNFVGLSRGFVRLLSKKKCASYLSLLLMGIIALALIALPIFVIGGRFFHWAGLQEIEWGQIGWEHMLPVFALEFILIYFFRVVLNRYNAIQTQIMQLELRQSLCQFIQSYAKYSKKIKENNGSSLEKFENLIFSNILANDNNMPGTFDGIDTITKLAKEIRGTK